MSHVVHKGTGLVLERGDELITNRGEHVYLVGHSLVGYEGNLGRIHVKSKDGVAASYFPASLNCKIVRPAEEGPEEPQELEGYVKRISRVRARPK